MRAQEYRAAAQNNIFFPVLPVGKCYFVPPLSTKRRHRLSTMLIVIALLIVAGCAPQRQNLSQIKIVELETQNQRITEEMELLRDRFHEISLSRRGLVSQQIIAQQVTFRGGGDTLQDVRDRQLLRCGGNADLPGFGYLDPDSSEFVGFDIDICRAIGAAILGEQGASQIEVTSLTSKLRFTALQAGEIDMLSRNTTWTFSRDSELGVDFAAVTFYDGQGMMVRVDSDIYKLSDLRDKAICVQANSTSASNVVDYYENVGLTVEVRAFNDRVAAFNEYVAGGCDAYTGDKTSLISQRTLLNVPFAHKILADELSREPLGPVVRHEDDNWKDIVSWSIQCLFNAEALDVSQDNVEEQLESTDLEIQTLLGVDTKLGEILGLPNDFCYQIIRQVGNYEDIYNRHLGPDTDFNLPRGLNALYSDGGLLYPLPFK